MNARRLPTLDDFLEASDRFDEILAKAGDAVPSGLLEDIAAWLRECVAHGRFIPPEAAERRAFRSLVHKWSARLRDHGVPVDGLDRLAEFDPAAGIPLDAKCPYPGLEAYGPSQRGRFFGRTRLIEEYAEHLQEPSRRTLVIIGASGSGKSSIALAGVIPKLRDTVEARWLFAPTFTPGNQPLAAMAAAVAEAVQQPARAPEIEDRLRAADGGLLAYLAELCSGRPLVLLVDQFEELFTLCRDIDEQKAFADVLCALCAPGSAADTFSCRILLTLRTDHLARLEASNALKPLHTRLITEQNFRYLGELDFESIRRVIAEPAKEVGLRFSPPTLIDKLASQTAGLANGLPLLQFALRRLWDTRPKNDKGQPLDLVTAQQVNALPDVQHALGTVAEGLFQDFSAGQRKICERLMQELIVLDETFEEPLRRRRNEPQLVQVLEHSALGSPEDVRTIIDRFLAAGLLRRFGTEAQSQVEVAHEALLRHWPHINRMITGEEAKERLHMIKQIGREAAEWMSRGRSEDYVSLRGERLARALQYAREGWLAEHESAEYVAAAQDLEQAEQRRQAEAEEQRRRAEEADRAAAAAEAQKLSAIAERRKAQRRLKWAIAALPLLLLPMLTFAYFTYKSWDAQVELTRKNDELRDLERRAKALEKDTRELEKKKADLEEKNTAASKTLEVQKYQLEAATASAKHYREVAGIQVVFFHEEEREKVVPALKNLGLTAELRSAKAKGSTNQISYGKQVTRADLQAVAVELVTHGVTIKRIAPARNVLTEKLIQVVHSSLAEPCQVLTVSEIRAMGNREELCGSGANIPVSAPNNTRP